MKKQIPNILSVIRLLLIPAVIYMFILHKRVFALALFALASGTDVLDGHLARKNGWITDLGKVLDPMADKLLQFAVAVCLALENSVLWIVAGVIFLKEGAMLLGGYIVLRKKKVQVVSRWYGKLATVIYFTIMSILIAFPSIAPFDIILSAVLCIVLVSTLAMYYFDAFKGIYGIKLGK